MKIRKLKQKVMLMIICLVVILGMIFVKTYAANSTLTSFSRSAFLKWYKSASYGDTATYSDSNGATHKIYTKFTQIINDADRKDKVVFLLDMVRRNPIFCLELGVSTPSGSKANSYTISYKTLFDGLDAKRTTDTSNSLSTIMKSSTNKIENGILAYIMCNRYSNWYSNSEFEKLHNKDELATLEKDNSDAFTYFKNNGSSGSIGHKGYSSKSLFMNIGQHAFWTYWRTWLMSTANKDDDGKNDATGSSLEGKIYLYDPENWDNGDTAYTGTGDASLNALVTKHKIVSEGKNLKATATKYANYLKSLNEFSASSGEKVANKETKYEFKESSNTTAECETSDPTANESGKITLRNTDAIEIKEDNGSYIVGPISINFAKNDEFGSINSVGLYSGNKLLANSSQITKIIDGNGKEKTLTKSQIEIMASLTDSKGQSNVCDRKEVQALNIEPKDKIYMKIDNMPDTGITSLSIKVRQVRQKRNVIMVPIFEAGGDKFNEEDSEYFKAQRFVTMDPQPKDSIVEAIFDIPMTPTPTTEKGNLKIVKTDQSGNKWAIEGIKFAVISSEGQTVANLETNANGETTTVELPVGTYRIKETSVPTGYTLRTDTETVSITKNTTLEFKFANPAEEIKKGKLKIIKTYADGITKLAIKGIKFDIISSTGQVVASIETDENGEATTGDLEVGTYTIKETSVPAGYKLRTDTETVIVNENTTREFRFANPMYPTTKIAGIVWLDRPGNIGKETVLDYAYNANGDQLLEGIKVKLQGGSQGTQETTTDSSGRYEFNDVNTSEINDLYVEFEYNGQKYQSVPKLQKGVVSNGSITYTSTNKYDTTVSKAEEGSNRTAYTEKYKTIDNNSGLTYTETTNGNQKVSKVNYNSFSNITASTKLAGINFEQSDIDQDGFRLNVNLGLMERPETDFALYKDIYKASVTKINDSGAEEVKDEQVYNKRSQNGYEGDWAKIVVDESLIYDTGNLISRKYKNSSGTFAGVQLYVDYIIELENQSGVIGMPKDIVDYYDSSIFTIDSVKYANRSGTDYTGAEDIQYSVSNSELKITNTKSLRSGEKVYILVRQKLKDPEGTLGSLPNYNPDDETTRKTSINYAEIKSYYTDDGLIDSDSAPGNFNIGQTSMEDDEAKSPKFIIRLPDVKEVTPSITGTVWNDALTAKAVGSDGEAEVGNGYNNPNDLDTTRNQKDSPLKDVEVKIEKEGGSWSEKAYTDDNGRYKFIPPEEGKYKVSYKISDGQNYEATIFNVENVNTTDENWYKNTTNSATSMAKEDNTRRNEINSVKEQTKETTNENKEIWANTPSFKLAKEYTEDMSEPDVKEYNIDFGIAKRPESKITVSVYIDSIKVIASDKMTVISDSKDLLLGVNKVGRGLKYTAGRIAEYTERDEVKTKDTKYALEISDSALTNSSIIVEYKAIVKNTGNIDFTGEAGKYSERYERDSTGKYIAKGDVVKTSINELAVYIPNSLVFDKANSDTGWKEANKTEIENMVTDDVKNNLSNNNIIITEGGSQIKTALKPGEEKESKFQVSKVIDSVTINNGDINLTTSTEALKTENDVGKTLTGIILGNMNPKLVSGKVELKDTAEDDIELVVTPETGDNKIPYVILLTGLTILAGGIIIIKKKV